MLVVKSQRGFLLRLTEEKRLEPDTGKIVGRCAVCGRDIWQWEIDLGYAVFDSHLFCGGCNTNLLLR